MGLDEKFQNELIEAIYTVSRRGAKGIVILEKTLDVDRYLKDFVKVDAIFSSVLLESLLSHDSPFRGGAIVIKGNRIVMVSEHLPSLESLSHQKDLDHLHLAAIGLTESTDAVVAILPGDGKVSFAWHGKLKQDLFKHELEIRLKEEFGVRK
jgi:diadenylate cyclase